MPTDLYYFYESDLNKGDFVDFYDSLPDHLKLMFRESMGGISELDRDTTNVLQGYHGPHHNGSCGDSKHLDPINGLQEVKYWWGVSKNLNFVPIIGSIVYGIARAVGDTEWHSLYFDSKTGECLSHDKEVAASKLNNIGVKLYDSGKFSEAKEYFSNAYTHSSNSANYSVYKTNRDLAQNAVDRNNQAEVLDKEGNELHRLGKYEEAFEKFDQAYKKCTKGYISEARFKSNRDIAKNNWADALNKQGNELFEQKNYSGALEKYNQAYQNCTDGYKNEQIFKDNKNKAQDAIDRNNQADLLDKEGNELHRQGKYEEAFEKFDQAYKKCTKGYSSEARFKSNRDIAKNNWADALNKQGNELFEQKNYSGALEKYNQAYQKCTDGYKNEQTFKDNRNKAQDAIDRNNQADLLDKEGNELLRQGKYEEAFEKFDQAYKKCTNGYSSEARFKSNRDIAKNNWADALNKQGNELFEQKNYSGALEKYNQAYQNCTDGYKNEQIFKDNKNKAQDAIDRNNQADLLDKEGNELLRQGKYEEAFEKFDQAYKKCTNGYSSEARFKSNRDKVEAELIAIKLNSEGDAFFNNGEYSKAETKYQEAHNISHVEAENTRYKANIEKTKVELYAMDLKELGDKEFDAGRYDNAMDKFQQAHDKSSVKSNKMAYADCVKKSKTEKYNSVLMNFNIIITTDAVESELTELGHKLEIMIDNGYESDPEIINRFHVISLRISRMKMKSKLELINREDVNDIIESIMNLLETEIEILKILNITDHRLEIELKSLEERLDALEIDNESEEKVNDDLLVDIRSIGIRAEEIFEEVNNIALEKLGQNTHQEYSGNALELRDSLVAPIVETYTMDGMDNVLKLRFSSLESVFKDLKKTKLLSSKFIDSKNISVIDTVRQLAHDTNEYEITVFPLLVPFKNNMNHWVGLISEHTQDGIVVNYLDSENSNLEGLKECVLNVYKDLYPQYQVCFKEFSVEQQRYNNCGSELIENIVLYITGSRADQESAIFLHSSLYEQSVVSSTDESINLSNKNQLAKKLNSELNFLLKAFKSYEFIPGIIQIKLNKSRSLLCFEYDKHYYEIENDGKIVDFNIYNFVRTTLQNKRRPIPEKSWDTSFKLAKKQFISHLIKENKLEDQKGFLKEFHEFINELPDVSDEFIDCNRRLKEINFDDWDIEEGDANDPRFKDLEEIHKKMLVCFDSYKTIGKNYERTNQTDGSNNSQKEDKKIDSTLSFEKNYPKLSYKIKRIFEILNSLERGVELERQMDIIADKLGLSSESIKKLKGYFNASNTTNGKKHVVPADNNTWYTDDDMNNYGRVLEKYGVNFDTQFSNRLTGDGINSLPSIESLIENEARYISYNIGGKANEDNSGIHWIAIVLVKRGGIVTILYKDSKGDWNNSSEGIEAQFKEHYQNKVEFIRHSQAEQEDETSCGPMTIKNLEIMAQKVKEATDEGKDGIAELIRLFKGESDGISFTNQDQVQNIRISHILQGKSNGKANLKQDTNVDDLRTIITKLELINYDDDDDDDDYDDDDDDDDTSIEEESMSNSLDDIEDRTSKQKDEIESYVHKINNFYDQFKDWGVNDLKKWSKEYKGRLSKNFGDTVESGDELCKAIAVMDRANELATGGHRLRSNQKAAILIFMKTNEKGHISQINTGEGKTTIISVVAALKVMQGYKGHVITSNNVLAAEGVKDKKLFYNLLNISTADNNPDDQYTDGPKACYNKDVLYGSITSFQFDWLRDSFEQLKTLGGIDFNNIWVMLDEIDSLLIDQGSNIAKLSGPFPGMETLRYIYINIWVALGKTEEQVTLQIVEKMKKKSEELAKDLEANEDEKQLKYENYEDSLRDSFLEEIKKQIKSQKENLINKKVIAKHLHQYAEDSLDRWIEHAFTAKYHYNKNVEYKIVNDKNGENIIIPVDNQNTGVSMKNTILSNGLHQFLQIKHNVCLTYESLTSCYVSNLDYIKKYGSKLSGVTGTLGSWPERNLLGSVFNLGFSVIPPFKPKRFKQFPGMVSADEEFVNDVAIAALGEITRVEKKTELLETTEIKKPRSVLIVCTSILDVEIIANEIEKEAKSAGLTLKIFKYIDESDVHVTEKILQTSCIVIATNLAGRGTDFKTSLELENNGGLHVIEAFLPCNKRVEDQGLGRTSRQGNKGTGQIIVRRSEVKALGMAVLDIKNVDFDEIMELRDELETMRVDDIADNKVMELEFKGQIFSKFSSQYGFLKENHKTGLGSDVIKWKYVLKDLKEIWAFWLEKQAYTAKSIKEIVSKQKSLFTRQKDQLTKAVDDEYNKFLKEATPIINGKISHNPYYSICLAERYLENGISKSDRENAKSELEHALTISDTKDLYSVYIKLFEIAIEDGGQVLERYKRAVARIFLFPLEKSCPDYKKRALENLQKAERALAIEHDYLKELIEGRSGDNDDLKQESVIASIIVNQDQENNNSRNSNLFMKHLQSRLLCLSAHKGNIESLIKQMKGEEQLENPKDIIGHYDGVIIDAKVPRYLSNLDSENELKKHITHRSVDELEYVGMSSVYQLRKIHDVHEEVIAGAQIQLISAFALLASAMAFPFLLPVNGPIAGAMISEGITDIITALIRQGESGFDKKEYIMGKVISYGISLLTMGIGAIMSSTKILNKAVSACRSLATKLRAVKGPFSGICKFLANKLDKLALYLERMIEKIEFARKTTLEQAKYLTELKDANKLQQFQQLQKSLKVSNSVITHGKKFTQIVSHSAIGAIKGVVISVAIERIVIASLNNLMTKLQPIIKEKVFDIVNKRIKSQSEVINNVAESDINRALSKLLETSLEEDVQYVSKEIALGIFRHSSNWKMQLAALATDSIFSGIDIATCTNSTCDKFIDKLSKQQASKSGSANSKTIDKIIASISDQISSALYSKIVAITGKAVVTLPKALYRGYKSHQEQKADKRAISDMRQKLNEIGIADDAAKAVNTKCAHDAVSETLGLDINKGSKQLADASNLAASGNGASVEDTRQLFKKNGIDVTSCGIEDAKSQFQKQNSDRGVVCLSNDKGIGHVIAVTMNKNDNSIMVTENGRNMTFDQYRQNHGYTNAEFIIPKDVNKSNLSNIQHKFNLNRIVRATHPIDYVGQGQGMKFGQPNFISDSVNTNDIGKIEGRPSRNFLLNAIEGNSIREGANPAHARSSHVGIVENKSTFKTKTMQNKKYQEALNDKKKIQTYQEVEGGIRRTTIGRVEKFEGYDFTHKRLKNRIFEYVTIVEDKVNGEKIFKPQTCYPCKKPQPKH